jgi:hypothetical protein
MSARQRRLVLWLSAGIGLVALAAFTDLLVQSTRIELPELSRAQLAPEECPPPRDDERFFGPGRLDLWADYSQLWQEMKEPILACGPFEGDEVFRLTWMHSFTRYPQLVVGATRTGATHTLAVAVSEWVPKPPGGVSPRLRTRRERALSGDEWGELSSAIRAADFWNTPGGLKGFGDDGATWLLEGRRGRGYHMVIKWSPNDGSFRTAAMFLIRLAGLPDPEPR